MRARVLRLWNVDNRQHEPSSDAPLLLLVELQLPYSVVIEEPGWERAANEALITSKVPIRLARIDGGKITFAQRLATISGASILLAHTGAPALSGAAMMAHGSVIVEVLRYVGRNSSVSIGGGIAWTSMPEILRMPFEFSDDEAVPSSRNCFSRPARSQGVRIKSVKLIRTLGIAVTLWSKRRDSPFGGFVGSAPRYTPNQLDRTCEFLQRSTDVSMAPWLCSHTSIALWDDALPKKRDYDEEPASEPNSDILFLAYSA
jgi:hypothetical protein